jgi:hypothetical protein
MNIAASRKGKCPTGTRRLMMGEFSDKLANCQRRASVHTGAGAVGGLQ